MDEDFNVTKPDSLAQLKKELEYLLTMTPENKTKLIEGEFKAYAHLFERYLEEHGSSIEWDRIENLPDNRIMHHNCLSSAKNNIIGDMLKKLVVIKLNGGLGTTMNCHDPKSTIKVKEELTFLDLTVQQIKSLNEKYRADVPLVLMNSFFSDAATEKVISKYNNEIKIYTFYQGCYPRLLKETLLPIVCSSIIEDSNKAWYPPGHGNFYDKLKNSGLLQTLIDDGRIYCFISNIENLGANVDLNILNFLLDTKKSSLEFIMEITNKTIGDVEKDTLIYYEKKLRYLEKAHVPKNHIEKFKCLKRFRFFNTNNLWIKLDSIDRVLSEQSMDLEITVEDKTLKNNITLIEFKTAIGAAIKYFNSSFAIIVPRSRFLPVKTTSDLFLVMSNLYCVHEGWLIMNPSRRFPDVPVLKLGHGFNNVKEFLSRFRSIPDILELNQLFLYGDITFGENISLKGVVAIVAKDDETINIQSNAIVNNKSICGLLEAKALLGNSVEGTSASQLMQKLSLPSFRDSV